MTQFGKNNVEMTTTKMYFFTPFSVKSGLRFYKFFRDFHLNGFHLILNIVTYA